MGVHVGAEGGVDDETAGVREVDGGGAREEGLGVEAGGDVTASLFSF